MKKILLGLTFITSLAIISCGEKTETVKTTDAQATATTSEGASIYGVDKEISVIDWKGGKIYEDINKPEDGHYGILKLKEGELSFADGKLESGKFVADFASFESKDLDGDADSKLKLDGHLKGEDFLDIEKYPTATFEITSVNPLSEGNYNSEVSGNLDFRGIPKNITFKANIVKESGVVTFKTEEFAVNRKDFGINFSGGKGSVIKDEVLLKADITAKAK